MGDLLKIQRNLATARHEQTNGQVERTIRTVKQILIADVELRTGFNFYPLSSSP